ncbi:IucA/IucC family siderophore biosynthesis protein [Micromonospora sp. WMMD1102]|uniref:IucA/IucC family siderophore biosynthesis protein n=1 Tax=Micromonospora sp. WMMD1102 TaxID=3016105 RepID=UPI002414EB93|nr:IucA/IucC family siderophore biosynthesis protein [Micromonospora sp. WMMD1102]MDG4784808.1 IucA/IucC family siderophore biosynthesis protein [Micromonospora sp. WMMD1102]
MTTRRPAEPTSLAGGGPHAPQHRTTDDTVRGSAAADDDAERQLFQRVLDALLREDHLGLAGSGRPAGRWWLTRIPGARLALPVRSDGFQHELRTAAAELLVLPDADPNPGPDPDPGPDSEPERKRTPEPFAAIGGDAGSDVPVRVVRDLDGLLDVLAPVGDPEAEQGWRVFRAECRDDLVARRLADRTRSRVYAELLATRAGTPDGMAGALLDDVLAARTDHPVYPTSRARIGLDRAALLGYAPEHAPRFALCWLPVPHAELTLAGTLPPWWPASGQPGTVLLPVHPLTAERFDLPVLRADASDLPEVLVRPTLSTRTVALVDDPYTHLKLPLATATLGARNIRTIGPGTLVDGAELHRLLARIAAAEPAFAGRILHADESCYGHAGDPVRSFLVRRFPAELTGRTVVPVAALAAEDPAGGTVAQRIGGPDPRPLLESYLDLLVDWHAFLWLRHGVALEAHQQNIHLVLDRPARKQQARATSPTSGNASDSGASRGGPLGGGIWLLYKDNDGARLVRRPGPALRDDRMWVTDPGELADVFTTITLHLAAAAPLRALAERGVPVPDPGTALRTRLIAARDRWAGTPAGAERDAPAGWDVAAAGRQLTGRVLTADRLPVKAMLTAGTLLSKQRTGCADINKYYRRTGPNYLRSDR